MTRRAAACALLAALCVSPYASAADVTVTIEPYTKDEFPQWARDIRRAEIISLGSLPFVTLTTMLGYSIVRWGAHGWNAAYQPDILAKSSEKAGLDTDEQKTVLYISLGISLALGLTDLTINVIKRHRRSAVQASAGVTMTEAAPAESGGAPDTEEEP